MPAPIMEVHAVREACAVLGDSVYMSFIQSVGTPTKKHITVIRSIIGHYTTLLGH